MGNFYMEYFEKITLEAAEYKSSIVGKFVVWMLGKKNLDLFPKLLKKQHPNNQLTVLSMEHFWRRNPFLMIGVIKILNPQISLVN